MAAARDQMAPRDPLAAMEALFEKSPAEGRAQSLLGQAEIEAETKGDKAAYAALVGLFKLDNRSRAERKYDRLPATGQDFLWRCDWGGMGQTVSEGRGQPVYKADACPR